MLILLLDNDIEQDPGTLFSKCWQESFDQSRPKFGENRGMQCAAIALHFLVSRMQTGGPKTILIVLFKMAASFMNH